jgi:tetratricopeptide (TPR) repeat protein
MARNILFYPACSTHVRNFEPLLNLLSDCIIEAINVEPYRPYEIGLENVLREHKFVYHSVDSENVPEQVFHFSPEVVVFGAGGEDPFTINLCFEAKRRGIPTLAIEEVNQLTLNQGLINFYTLPFDMLMVATDAEKEMLEHSGFQGEIVVTGLLQNGIPNRKARGQAQLRSMLGVDKKRVLLYTTSPLQRERSHSLETLASRLKALELIRDGLPSTWSLVVKLHPREELKSAVKFVKEIIPDALVILRDYELTELLSIADAVLSRGNSYTCLEAIQKKIPLLIFPQGLPTIFDGNQGGRIVHSPDDLRHSLANLDSINQPSNEFIRKHFWNGQSSPATAIARIIAEAHEVVPTIPAFRKLFESSVRLMLPTIALRIAEEWAKLDPHGSASIRRELSLAWLDRQLPSEQVLSTAGKLIGDEPDSLDAWQLMSILHKKCGQFSIAASAMQNAIHLHPQYSIISSIAQLKLDLVDTLLKQRRVSEAKDVIDSLSLSIPEWALFNYYRGLVALECDELGEAREAFSSAVLLCPSMACAHYQLGTLLMRRGNYTEAESALKLAIQYDEAMAQAHRRLGSLLLRQGDDATAEVEFKKAIHLEPSRIMSHVPMVVMKIRKNKIGEALRAFTHLLLCATNKLIMKSTIHQDHK